MTDRSARTRRKPSGTPRSEARDVRPASPIEIATTSAFEPLFATVKALLARAIDRHAQWLGPNSLLDPWRGMHLDRSDVEAALGTPSTVDRLAADDAMSLIAECARAVPTFARAAEIAGLTSADLATISLAIAPDLDLCFERVFAYLQDDISRKRPTLDLLLRLFCAGADARIELWRRFDRPAPLACSGIVEIHGAPDTSLLARPLAIAPLWRHFLLGQSDLDPLLRECTRELAACTDGLQHAYIDANVREQVEAMLARCAAGDGKARAVLVGPHGAGKARLSAAIAGELGMRALAIDLRDAGGPRDVEARTERALLYGTLQHALPCFYGVQRLATREPQLVRALMDVLAVTNAPYFVWLTEPLPELHAHRVEAKRIQIDLPSPTTRTLIWKRALAEARLACATSELEELSARFVLSEAQIEQAACDVADGKRIGAGRETNSRELASAARALCGGELAHLAQRIAPRASFDTLVGTPEVMAQLGEIRDRVALRERVRRTYTCGSLHARNIGVTALFAGPSGTGKTLAAEVIAGELGYDLFRIELSAVVSKYIGETEKNLDRVFAAAENANAVLLFDEADALFGKRSEVKDAHDRYANIEIAYLLQKMEQFDGLAILSTNLKQNLDEAFARRLTFTVNFAFPEVGERRRLWESLWPPLAPRADDVDLAWFAHEYALAGGNIRNAVLAAVHLAAANGQVVTREHLLHATRREFQKLGKNLVLPVRPGERLAS